MSEFFQAGSGEWNKPGNQFNSTELAKEPTKAEVLKGRENMFGIGATRPSADAGSHVDAGQPEQKAPKSADSDEKVAEPKKANPFV